MMLNQRQITRRSLLLAAAAVTAEPARLLGNSDSVAPAAMRTLRSDSDITAGDGRSVRVSTWSSWGLRRGIILFSHGALSAPEKYERVIGPWNAAGFEVRAPLHVDSTDHPDHAKFGMLDSWRARLLDMRALAAATEGEYFAAGHSYGALTALTLGGVAAEIPPGIAGPLRDPRVKLVVTRTAAGRCTSLPTMRPRPATSLV